MSQFKPGDRVTPITVDRYTDRDVCPREEMRGRILVVHSVHSYENGDEIVLAGIPGKEVWQWHADDLRTVFENQVSTTKADPAPAPAATRKPKPIRRGDLVECRGVLWVVYSEGEDFDGYYWIASLTGIPETYRIGINELTRVGSIRKKIKRIKKEMEGAV